MTTYIEDEYLPRWRECGVAGHECCICRGRIKLGEIMFIAPGIRVFDSTPIRQKTYMHRKCMANAMEFAPADTYQEIRQRVLAGGEFLQ